MEPVGHKTESVCQRYEIVAERDLVDGVARYAAGLRGYAFMKKSKQRSGMGPMVRCGQCHAEMASTTLEFHRRRRGNAQEDHLNLAGAMSAGASAPASWRSFSAHSSVHQCNRIQGSCCHGRPIHKGYFNDNRSCADRHRVEAYQLRRPCLSGVMVVSWMCESAALINLQSCAGRPLR
jgi:hypothetical protein